MNQVNILSPDDITRLMEDRSAGAQMDVIGKVTSHYASAEDGEAMTQEQSAIAEDIFRILLAKAEVQMRTLIAINLQQSNKLPPELVRQMAEDVQEVALPIIKNSPLLSDQDLVEIISRTDDEAKLLAVAKRDLVSEAVSEALVETRKEVVVTTLVENVGASIADQTMEKIVERHVENPKVVESVMQRGAGLPVPVIEKLVKEMSGTLREKMEKKYGSLVEMKELRKAFDQSLQLTNLKLIGLKTPDNQLMRLIERLNGEGKLSPFAALCTADLPLFEVSLAHLLHIPLKNVQLLMKDKRGLKALYLRAELPESMYEAVEFAIQAIIELEEEGRTPLGKPVLTPFQVMGRMQQLAEGRVVEGIDYMFMMMQKQARENVRYQTQNRSDASKPN